MPRGPGYRAAPPGWPDWDTGFISTFEARISASVAGGKGSLVIGSDAQRVELLWPTLDKQVSAGSKPAQEASQRRRKRLRHSVAGAFACHSLCPGEKPCEICRVRVFAALKWPPERRLQPGLAAPHGLAGRLASSVAGGYGSDGGFEGFGVEVFFEQGA
jgi:hypothetical protein